MLTDPMFWAMVGIPCFVVPVVSFLVITIAGRD